MPEPEPVCWTLTTGEAGMASQVAGLAEAVGLPYSAKVSRPRKPWSWLPGHLCPGVLNGLTADSSPLTPPWPDLLITCGRRSTPLSIAIRKQSEGRTFTVHIQDPRIPARYFDMVVPMAHDPIRGDNVFPTELALHHVTKLKLAEAARHFTPRFASLPRPLVAVLIGGRTRKHPFTRDECLGLTDRLDRLRHEYGAGLIITTSRRTGEENTALIRDRLSGKDTLIWSGEGENPYMGMLALADFILATEDSVSMVSEACASGHPVYTLPLEGDARRLAAFQERLQQAGITRRFADRLEPWASPVQDETARIAGLIRDRLRERGLSFPEMQQASG